MNDNEPEQIERPRKFGVGIMIGILVGVIFCGIFPSFREERIMILVMVVLCFLFPAIALLWHRQFVCLAGAFAGFLATLMVAGTVVLAVIHMSSPSLL